MLIHLMLGERLSEDHTFLAVLESHFPQMFGRYRRHHHRHHALVLELIHLLLEAALRLADGVREGNAHVIEEQQPGVGSDVADLVE